MDETVPDGSVLFLGDSITHGLVTSSVVPNGVNFGIGGLTAIELLDRLPSYGSVQRAKYVSLMVGTNDVMQGRGSTLLETYRSLLRAIPVPVVLSTIPPLDKFPRESRQAAHMARQACLSSTKLVDLHSALLNVPGALRDGVHLSSKGYAVWIDLLRQEMP